MRLKHLTIGTVSAIILSAVACTGAAFAQDQTDEQPMSELVVTAQKREQRLQDVPISVTVVGAQLLKDAGVKDIKDLTVLTPGLIVTSSTTEASTTARIRGIGTVGDNPGLESSVVVMVDGIYRPRNGVALTDLGDLSRVEVLKGPQGTLFGKNATAGVINIITAKPSFNPSTTVEGTAGNFNDFRGVVSMTGPLAADTLAGSLFLAGEDRDGYQSVVTGAGPRTSKSDMSRGLGTGRGELLWLPTTAVDMRFIADYSRHDEECCTAVTLAPGSFATTVTNGALGTNVLVPANPASRITYSNRDTFQTSTDGGLSGEVNWALSDALKLTSISAWRHWRGDQGQDTDFTTLDLLYRAPNDKNFNIFDQLSQEFRASGSIDRLNWVVGGYLAAEKLTSSQTLTLGNDLATYLDLLVRTGAAAPTSIGGTGTSANPVTTGGLAYILGGNPGVVAGGTEYDLHHQLDQSQAVFANGDFKLTDTLTASAGLRYTRENKHVVSNYQNIGGNGTCTSGAILGEATRAAQGGPLAQKLFLGYFCAAMNDSTFNNLTLNQTRTDPQTSGTGKLAWKPNENILAYVSYARGFKAGGFNLDRERVNYAVPTGLPVGFPNGALVPDLDTGFAPETVQSYEGGVKTTWMDGRLLLNTAVFQEDYRNFQLNAFDGIAFSVTSIPTVRSKGVDADVLWQTPVTGLNLQGGLTYADTRYGQNLPGYNVPTSAFYISPTPATVPNGALYRLSGATISFAPKYSGSLALTYRHPLSDGLVLRGNLSGKYNSAYNTGSDLNPLKAQPAYTVVNARLSVGAADERWTVEAWSQNLTDVHYIQVAFDGTFQPNQVDAFMGQPRVFGLTVRFKH